MRTAAIVVTCSALAAAPALRAQSAQTFEVASIRRNVTGSQQGGGLAAPMPGGRFMAIGATLSNGSSVMLTARRGSSVALRGSKPDRFDVNARADGERSPTEIALMFRPLLADRFQLLVHAETREMPVYVLAAARTDRRPDRSFASRTRNVMRRLATSFQAPRPGGLRRAVTSGLAPGR